MNIIVNIILAVCVLINVWSAYRNIKTYRALRVLNGGDLIVHEYSDTDERSISVSNLDLTKLNDNQFVIFKTTIIEVRD